MPALLDIEKLRIEFDTEHGRFSALQDISIQIQSGEIMAMVGESGSGKSVTALAILRLLHKNARYVNGHIFFQEAGRKYDLLQLKENELRRLRGNRIAMIFQEPMTSLNPVLRCGEQVMEAILQHSKISKRDARKKTLSLFEQVQLPQPASIFDRYPHQLSGGQKQRVMIAMAISGDPALLICDEPTTALDVTVQKSILQTIKQLQQSRQLSVLFITHDLGVVAEIADRVTVMYKGEIVETGPVTEIMTRPRHPYTKGLLACRPVLYGKHQRLPVVSDFLSGHLPQFTEAKSISPQEKNNSTEKLLQVEDLSVWYPGKKSFFGRAQTYVKAVDGVSFDVFEGETLGLVGESGCGKTTLGRALLRLVEPTSGHIRFQEKDLLAFDQAGLRNLRKDIQIIFQDPYSSLNPSMTIGTAIEEVLQVQNVLTGRRQRKEKVIELLEKVSLQPSHYARYPHEFSGGQRQRIVIARALALNPSFVVCDESVSALDVSVQAQVLNLLNDLKKEFRFTIIFISHDLSVVHYISDRIMVMQKGQIVETGSADQIFNRPANAYTQSLIHSIPRPGPSVN